MDWSLIFTMFSFLHLQSKEICPDTVTPLICIFLEPDSKVKLGFCLPLEATEIFYCVSQLSTSYTKALLWQTQLVGLSNNIRASIKQSLPALKGRRGLRGTVSQKIQQEALWCSVGRERAWRRAPSASPPNTPASLHADGYERQRTVLTPRIGQLSYQRKLVFLKRPSLK